VISGKKLPGVALRGFDDGGEDMLSKEHRKGEVTIGVELSNTGCMFYTTWEVFVISPRIPSHFYIYLFPYPLNILRENVVETAPHSVIDAVGCPLGHSTLIFFEVFLEEFFRYAQQHN